jgi:uncharacterized protein YndB with AHSA1/START domain
MKSIRIFQPLSARPARIFRALSEAEELAAWQADVVRGRVAPGRTLELGWPKLGVSVSLEVRAVEPARRVLLSQGAAQLELTIQRGGIELCHTAPMDEDERAGTESSWRISLAILATYLMRHSGRPRRVHWATARGRGSPELCHAYFTDASLLRSWLGTAETDIGAEGSIAHLSLEGGRRARCPVIAHTHGRDLAVRWQEMDDSVLVMRTLPSPEPAMRTLLLGWSRWSEPPDAQNVERQLDAAVERLARRLEALAYA